MKTVAQKGCYPTVRIEFDKISVRCKSVEKKNIRHVFFFCFSSATVRVEGVRNNRQSWT